jgi:signal transduction histidine kinase
MWLQLEAGRLQLDETAFRLRDLLGDAVKAHAALAIRKGLELVYHVDPGVPDALYGDMGRLKQIIIILVDNALKVRRRLILFAPSNFACVVHVRGRGVCVLPCRVRRLRRLRRRV